ncbi:MAG: magnesium protoporphyrin IX methyltransferase [Pseudomonadota bacterium]
MTSATYTAQRAALETYFDRTAADAWAKLTSDAPVSGVRATVRAGRDAMRATLLEWLPDDLSGRRVLDAGCGAGQLAVEAARRGADVVAVDVAATLVGLARERAEQSPLAGRIDFRVGDAFDESLGRFDHIVAMDSLIHYRMNDILSVLRGFTARCDGTTAFTFAPRTAALTTMLAVGRLFPRSDRSPAVRPASPARLKAALDKDAGAAGFGPRRTRPVKSGFYFSQAMELARA